MHEFVSLAERSITLRTRLQLTRFLRLMGSLMTLGKPSGASLTGCVLNEH